MPSVLAGMRVNLGYNAEAYNSCSAYGRPDGRFGSHDVLLAMIALRDETRHDKGIRPDAATQPV
jgi:hypothetical protein